MSIIKRLINELLGTNKPKQQAEKQKPNPQPQAEKEGGSAVVVKHHRVAGVSNYLDNILTFAKENPDYSLKKSELMKRKKYDEYIYQYCFSSGKVELIPEPTNPHDPNAVQVLIDKKLVGYIKAGSCKHILNLINGDRIEKIEAKIKGGNHKLLYYDECEEKYILEDQKLNIGIELSIHERNK